MHYVLLCDYGLDDAAATAQLFACRAPSDTVDIVPVGGNVSLDRSYRNACTLLANLPHSLQGVRLVDTSALPQPGEDLPSIHGKDGMGDLFSPAPCPACVPVVAFADWVKTIGPQDVLISLGPCTVTEKILEICPVERLYLMAGSVSHHSNWQGREFNHALDVGAFAACVKHPHRIATLDTCRHPYFNMVQRPYTGSDPLMQTLMARHLELARARHADRCYVYDWVLMCHVLGLAEFGVTQRRDPDGNCLSVLEVRP